MFKPLHCWKKHNRELLALSLFGSMTGVLYFSGHDWESFMVIWLSHAFANSALRLYDIEV